MEDTRFYSFDKIIDAVYKRGVNFISFKNLEDFMNCDEPYYEIL